MPRPIPIATIFRIPETGLFGFSYLFEGRSPHYRMDGFSSVEAVLAHCDPHRECIWTEPAEPDGRTLLVSRDYVQESVAWKMAHLTFAELAERRNQEAAGR